jgi:hypothetical protein
MNFKVKCVGYNLHEREFTIGKVYEVKNGEIVKKEGITITPLTPEDKARAMEMGKAAYKALTPAQAAMAQEVTEFLKSKNML